YLYAGRHLGSKQVSPKFILEEFAAPSFDIIFTLSTLEPIVHFRSSP
ncbi:hypothetical protein DB41_BW00040, partial [Neochlamydia sp. TUME1]